MATTTQIPAVIEKNEAELLAHWVSLQLNALTRRQDLLSEQELRTSSQKFILELLTALRSGDLNDISGASWERVRTYLNEFSKKRSELGFAPWETATFVLSFKQPLFERLRTHYKDSPSALPDEMWLATELLDKLALHTIEAHQRGREGVILRQQEEIMELSTPVVSLWDDILALPLIGTLDSARTQVVMQNMLEAIVAQKAAIAIIDITGVPTVDTLVAQHLLKTVAAARLMGADCIISGIRPQIAQTVIHLGVDLSGVITKATLADAFKLALSRLGYKITKQSTQGKGD